MSEGKWPKKRYINQDHINQEEVVATLSVDKRPSGIYYEFISEIEAQSKISQLEERLRVAIELLEFISKQKQHDAYWHEDKPTPIALQCIKTLATIEEKQ